MGNCFGSFAKVDSRESPYRGGGAEPIPWKTRMKVAISAARGLAFLHDAQGNAYGSPVNNLVLVQPF
ncbi:unnamed protein product, partial [Thlaspi arvense]